MPRALIDTSVLFAAAYQRDSADDGALLILRGVDHGSLPEAVVLECVLAETLNGLTTHAGHDAAVDFLDRIEENGRFHIESVSSAALAAGKAAFRRYEPLSFVDGCLVGGSLSHRSPVSNPPFGRRSRVPESRHLQAEQAECLGVVRKSKISVITRIEDSRTT